MMSRASRSVSYLCALTFLLAMQLASPARAQVVIDGPFIDDTTKGDWRAAYGQCYSVIPYNPFTTLIPESRVGPGLATVFPNRYRIVDKATGVDSGPAQCITGPLSSIVDFGVEAVNEPGIPPDNIAGEAFVWHYCEPTDPSCERDSWRVLPGASQWNQCLGQPWNSVWDSEITTFEPFVFTLSVDRGGDTRLAYYFLEGAYLDGSGECRNMQYELFINPGSDLNAATPDKVGTIQRLDGGKYLVFDVKNLPDVTNQIVLRLKIVPDDPANQCNAGVNVVLGGAFLGGSICGTPSIDIRKQAEGPDSRTFDFGAPVTYEIVVTNNGPVTLTNVKVTDPVVPTCNADLGTLAPGESKTYFCDGPPATVNVDSEATATGTGNGVTVTDKDPTSIIVGQPAALGNFAWVDTNGNGIQDFGETQGAVGAVATLYNVAAGVPTSPVDGVAPQTIGANGFYQFAGLPPGTYAVQFTLPGGYTRSPANQGGNPETDSNVLPTGFTGPVTLVGGQTDNSVDAGFVPPPATLGNRAWIDTDGDGIQDAGETTGLAGVVVTLYNVAAGVPTTPVAGVAPQTTGANGLYQFANLTPGTYAVQFTLPAGYTRSPAGQGGNPELDSNALGTGFTAPVTLAPGQVDNSVDAGFVPKAVECVPTSFWFTGNSSTYGTKGNIRTFTVNGVSVKVSAFGRNDSTGAWSSAFLGLYGEGLGVTDASEGTGANGTHRVDNVGGYDNYVLFEFSTPVVVTRAFLDSVVTDSDVTVWLGTFANPYNSHLTLSDSLLGSFGLKQSNATDSAYARWAAFNGGAVVANALVIAADADDTSPEDNFKISKLDTCVPGGPAPAKGAIGDYVWNDLNGNGVQESGEPGLDGVVVKLLDSANAVLQTKTTGDNPATATVEKGYYLFTGLTPGLSYKVSFTTPTGFNHSPRKAGGNPALDSDGAVSDAVVLSDGQINTTIDAGFVKQVVCTPFQMYFSGNSYLDGQDGNVRSFNVNGLTVKATAFSRNKSTGGWSRAWLGIYGEGLGVTDNAEGDGSNGHRVDNIDRDNFILFEFSSNVVVSKAYLGSVVKDSDISVWGGNVGSVNPMLSDALLNGFGLKETNQTTETTNRWAAFNSGKIGGNAFVVAADVTDTSAEDQFKLNKLEVCKPY